MFSTFRFLKKFKAFFLVLLNIISAIAEAVCVGGREGERERENEYPRL
jgi:hypothetical protein